MKSSQIMGSLLLAFALVGISARAETKIGYVDIQKAIQETSAGKKAKKDLETDFNKKKKELEKKEADLKKMNEDLEKKALVLSEEVRTQKQQELQQEMMKYRELVGKSQMDIQKRERDLTLPILEKIRGIVEDIAKKDSYTVILEKSEQSVLYANKDIDLTDRVVKEFEKAKK